MVADKLLITPASALSEVDRQDIRACKPGLIELLTVSRGIAVTAPTTNITTCIGCQHLLRHGTCGEPVSAGLMPSFGIVWPPEGYRSVCIAFVDKPVRQEPPWCSTP